MLVEMKAGVHPDVTFEMAVIVGFVLCKWVEAGLGPFVMTSAQDGQHASNSRHYSGNAMDIRTRHLWNGDPASPYQGTHDPAMHVFVEQLRNSLWPHGIDVVLHPEDDPPGGRTTPHLHVEYDPKREVQRVLWQREGGGEQAPVQKA